jgi:ribonuclease Z
MRIRVLGIAGGLPEYGLHHSGFHIETTSKDILIDAGEGISQQILKFNFGKNKIDDIYISHLHPDHFSGIFMLIQMLYLQKRTKPLNIYLPEEVVKVKEMFNTMYIFKEKFSFPISFQKIARNEVIVPIENYHLKTYREFTLKNNYKNPLKSFSFIIRETQKQIIFSSDIEKTNHLSSYLSKSKIIFIDAFHPQTKEILKLSDSFDGKIYLTHSISEDLKIALIKNKRKNIFYANENDEIIY